MNKGIEKEIKKKIKKYHYHLIKEENTVSDLYELLDKAKFIARCRECEQEENYSKLPLEKRYGSCRTDKACEAVTLIAEKIKQENSKIERIREEYGENLFPILQNYQPVLIDNADEDEKQWYEIFGTDYSKITEDKKISLIALIELDGGIYRLKDVAPIFDE